MKQGSRAAVLVALLSLAHPASAQPCENETAGCLPWGETLIGRVGGQPSYVSVLSGDGQTAMISRLSSTTPRGASFSLSTGVRDVDLASISNEIEHLVFTDLNVDGRCGTGWYDRYLRPGVSSFFFERINGTMQIRRRPDRLDQPAGPIQAWSLDGDIATGISDACSLQVGVSRAAPQDVDANRLWGRIGLVWNDSFPFVSNLPPNVNAGSPVYLFQLDDAAQQGTAWPSVYSGANSISPSGLWTAGYSTANVVGPPYTVLPYPAIWSLVSGSPVRVDFPVLPAAEATDVVGGLLGFTAVGYTMTGPTTAQAWRFTGPVPLSFTALGNANVSTAHTTSVVSDGTAVVPRADGSGVRFHSTLTSFTSSQRLAQLGLQDAVVSARSVSADGRIWGGDRGGDAVLVNTAPIKAVFLGDSYSSGEGARNWPSESIAAAYEAGTANESTNVCHRSVHAWPYLVKPRGSVATLFGLATDLSLGGFSWTFAACSGATTANFYDLIQGFTETGQAYGSPDGQVQRNRIPSDANLIAFTIGGNDAGFSKVATMCITLPCLQLYADTTNPIDDVVSKINTEVRTNLRQLYARLRGDFPSAEIFALGYPLLFEERSCGAGIGISDDEASAIRSAARSLNAVIEFEARQAGVHFVPVEQKFAGRNVCGFNSAINGINVNQVFGPQELQENLHPNMAGTELYAQALTEYLAQKAPFNRFGIPGGD